MYLVRHGSGSATARRMNWAKGPPVGFVNTGSKNSALDIGLPQSSGFGTVGSGDDYQRKHGIPDFEFDDFGISRLTPSRIF